MARKTAKAEATAPRTGELSRFQKFEPRRVHRSELKNAPYNPREINELNERKLREVLREDGLIEPLVWNCRTGNLVGGHQRLAQLDVLEHETGGNYLLDVAVVDMSPRKERRMNMLLNNDALQGDFSPEKLAAMFKGPDALTPDDVMLDQVDLEMILPEEDYLALFPIEEPEDVTVAAEAINAIAKRPAPEPGEAPETPFDGPVKRNAAGEPITGEDLEKYERAKEKRRAMTEELANDPLQDHVTSFTLVVVCGTVEERDALAKTLLAKQGHIDCRVLFERLGQTPPKREQA